MSLTADEKRDALSRVLRSHTFHRSDQLKTFLRYVCEAETQGRSEGLNEYLIGVEALGRPEGYSPAEDSSVRTRAYELRHKLDRYYSIEAPDEAIKIELPKGSYTPHFVKRPVDPVPDSPPVYQVPEKIPVGRWPLYLATTVCALAILVPLFWLRNSSRPSVDSVIQEAWGPLASNGANVLLVTATPLSLAVTPDTHETFGSSLYPAPTEAYSQFRQHRPLPPNAKLGMVFTDNLIGVGTMNAVVVTTNKLNSMGVGYQILPERVAPLSALRNRNAMLFGAPSDSIDVSKVMENTALVVDYEPSVREFVIRDRVNGQIFVPKKDASGDFTDVYGLLTVRTNRNAEPGNLRTVVFSGVTSTGTQGAAEFFASSRSLRDLRDRFARDSIKGFPPAYQVIVRCTFSNMLLLNYEYHSHRVLEKD